MGLYSDFKSLLDDGLREHNIDNTHGLHVSMDTNQAGTTMESRHDVSKDLILYSAVPGGGKMVHTFVKAALGKVSQRSVLKVIWPLMLTDYPGHYKIGRLGEFITMIEQSPGQDVTSGSLSGQTPKTPGGTKTTRRGRSGSSKRSSQTLKPFWVRGRPKCPKGFRYDFKRKMCVKKS